MPTIRKVSPAEAATWTAPASIPLPPPVPPITPAEAQALLAQLPDRSGISRMKYDRSGASWFARVYARGQALGRSFADRVYGSPARALVAAVAWRDATRRQFAAPGRPISQPRVVRVDRADWGQKGHYAYRGRRERRYFSDGRYGGSEGSRAAAERWCWQSNDEVAT